MIKKIFLLLTLIILFFFYLKIIINFYFNKTRLSGQDKMHISKDEKKEYENYPIVYFDFENNIDKHKFRKLFKESLKDPNHVFRNKLVNNRIIKSNRSCESIINDTIILTDKKLGDFSESELISLAMKNENRMIIVVNDYGYVASFSHLFYDGIRFTKIGKYVFDNYEEIKLPKFYYIPIYNELIIMRSLFTYFKNPMSRNLKTIDNNKIYQVKFSLKKFKQEKHKFNSGFTPFLSIIIAYLIFESSNKKKLTCGMILAFSNTTRFNNYSILPIEFCINEKYKELNYDDKIKYLQKQAEIKIETNKCYISSIYTITSVYGSQILNDYYKLDFLISGYPACKKHNFSINNSKIKSIRTVYRYTSMPVYLFHVSTKDNINFTFNFKTNEINLVKFKQELNKLFL